MKLFLIGCTLALATVLFRRLLADQVDQYTSGDITDSDSRLIDFFRARQSARPEGERAGGGESRHLVGVPGSLHDGEQG